MPKPMLHKTPSSTRTMRLGGLLAGAAALCLLAGVGGIVAAVAGVLAQPLAALAVRGWRDGALPTRNEALREAGVLALLWAAATVVLAAVVAWPLSSLLQTGSLASALGLSAVTGVALLGLWRLWPLWLGAEREGGPLREHWQALGELELSAWRGLGVAAIVLALAATVLLLAWPGVLGGGARWTVAVLFALATPALHLLLQQVAPAEPLPGFAYDDDDEEEDEPVALVDGEPLAPALYAAARSGRVERALELIELGADVSAPPPADERDQRSLAVLAAVLPDLRLLRTLIAHGIDLNATHAGMNPLLAATRDSWHGRPDAVMTLLANGADPRRTDAEGNTPLHHAARSSDPGVAALLRDAAAELDPLNHDGLSPLGVACASGNWRLAKFLLERGARPEPAGGQPVLLAAAGADEDDVAGVGLLLKHKARVDARDRRGRSALHEAALAGHLDIAAALLTAGADADARDLEGRSPFLEAARGGHLEMLERLLAHLPRGGADAAVAVDSRGRNALVLACVADSPAPALVQRLLDLGVDAEQRDADGKRAIDRAAEAGRWSLVAALDRAYP